MPSTPEIALSLPGSLQGKVQIHPSGRERDRKEVYWYYRFLEIGDHKRAAIDAGYPPDKAADIGRRLKYRFADEIAEAMPHIGKASLPLAHATLVHIMEAYQPGKTVTVTRHMKNGVSEEREEPHVLASPAMATVAERAAETVMDRFGLPRMQELHLREQDPSEVDFRKRIDIVVQEVGVEAARRARIITEFAEHREYFLAKLIAGDYDAYRYDDIIDVTPERVEETDALVLEAPQETEDEPEFI